MKQRRLPKLTSAKKILYGVFYVGVFYFPYRQLWFDMMTIALLILTCSQKPFLDQHKFDFIVCVCSIIARILVPELQCIFLSLSFFSLKINLATLIKALKVLARVKKIALAMFYVYLVTVYVFTWLYSKHEASQLLFGSFSRSAMTLFEVVTLDSWGSRGRILEAQEGQTGIPSILLCMYVFIMAYFYMNILIGLILDSLSNNAVIVEKEQEHFILFNGMYGKLVLFLTIINAILNLYEQDSQIAHNWSMMTAALFTFHSLFILLLQDKRCQYERSKRERMLMHLLSGPIALIAPHQLMCLFSLTKITTTPLLTSVLSGTYRVLPILFPNILLLSSSVLFMSAFSTHFYSNYIGFKGERYYSSLWETFYTYIQILTLDDWDANVLPAFNNETYIPHVIFPIYIVFSNFIFLNILIAQSCKFFKEVDYNDSLSRQIQMQMRPIDIIYQKVPIPKVHFTKPTSYNEMAVSENRKLMILSFKGRQVTVIS